MQTLGQWIKEDMRSRNMGDREYAIFWGITHPTVKKYAEDRYKKPQLDMLVLLSRATHTDIGFLVRLALPDVAYDDVPDTANIEIRIKALETSDRDSIIKQVDALLLQQEHTKHSKKIIRRKHTKGKS